MGERFYSGITVATQQHTADIAVRRPLLRAQAQAVGSAATRDVFLVRSCHAYGDADHWFFILPAAGFTCRHFFNVRVRCAVVFLVACPLPSTNGLRVCVCVCVCDRIRIHATPGARRRRWPRREGGGGICLRGLVCAEPQRVGAQFQFWRILSPMVYTVLVGSVAFPQNGSS